MSKKIRIRERKLGRQRAYGLYYHYEDLIEIDPRQSTKTYLNTLCHELLHKAIPEIGENKITKAASILSRGILQQNFRRIMK